MRKWNELEDEEYKDYQETAKKFFTSGYNKYYSTLQRLEEQATDCAGYMYVDFEKILRMQLEVCIQSVSPKVVLKSLWDEVDLLTKYLSEGKTKITSLSRQIRSRDKKLAYTGELYTARNLPKCISLLCETCTYAQLHTIIKKVFAICGGSFYQMVLWDVKEQLEGENISHVGLLERIRPVVPIKFHRTLDGEEVIEPRILLLVNTEFTISWLNAYTRDLCLVRNILRAANSPYLRINQEISKAMDNILRNIKGARSRSINEAYRFLISRGRVELY